MQASIEKKTGAHSSICYAQRRAAGLALLNPPFFLPFLFPSPSLFSFPSPSFLVFQFSLLEATTMKKLPQVRGISDFRFPI